MAYVVISLLLATIGLIVAYLHNLYSYWKKRGIPHEQPLPILGNLKGIGRTVHFRDVNQRIYNQFKGKSPFAGMYLFFSKAAFILDLDLAKNILIKDFSSFQDRGIFSNVHDDPLTGHLLTLEGEEWRAMRTKMSPVFTSGKMKFMFPTVRTVGDNLSRICAQTMAKQTGGVLELKDLCARYTTDVIGTCAFGIECNSLDDPNAEFRRNGRKIFDEPRHSQIVQAFIITNSDLAKKLRFKVFKDEMSEFFLGAVKSTVDFRLKNNIKRNDFMDMLIEMKVKNDHATKKSDGIDLSQGLTLEQLSAQAFVFFAAGFDTSSTTMSFCLYELAVNPDVQEQLRQEITETIEAHNGEITYESMNEMEYLDRVFSETLRKYPVLPHIVRKAVKDYRVPNTDHIIEKNTTIIIPVDAIHHDEAIYPDPDKFDPERFTAEAIQERHSCSYMPFGEGPRNCIGMRFGKMQAKVGLITLLMNYKFSTSQRTEIPVEISKENFIIATKNGIYLKVEKV